MMDTTTAFVRPSAEGHVEVVVNFGLVSGREATLAEVDRLARRLVAVAGHVQADAVRRHDMGPDTEAIVHQVVVRVAAPSSIAEEVRSTCATVRPATSGAKTSCAQTFASTGTSVRTVGA